MNDSKQGCVEFFKRNEKLLGAMNALSTEPSAPAITKTRFPGTEVAESILCIDNDATTRQFYSRVLRTPGYCVALAEDGPAGWEALRLGDFDLLITDDELPKRIGLELTKRLRSAGKTLPVILVSGSCSVDDAARSPRLSTAMTLTKPFTPAELLETVRELLCATSVRHRDDRFFPLLAEVLARIEPVSHWGINE
jgi:two-component system, chemotaxis family, chemotaxis protein CheY